MYPSCFVFPTSLAEDQLHQLRTIKDVLIETVIPLQNNTFSNRLMISHKMSQLCMDLRELTVQPTYNSLKWNSYQLLMSIVKIDLIIEQLKPSHSQDIHNIITICQDCRIRLVAITEECRRNSGGD